MHESTLPLDKPQHLTYDPLTGEEVAALVSMRTQGLAMAVYLVLLQRAGRRRWRVELKVSSLAKLVGQHSKTPSPGQVTRALDVLAEAGLVQKYTRTSPATFVLPLRKRLVKPERVPGVHYSPESTNGVPLLSSDKPEFSPESSPLLIDKEENKELPQTPMGGCDVKPHPFLTPAKARNIAKAWVDLILEARPHWPPKHKTAAVREQAIRNAVTLLLKTKQDGSPMVDQEEIESVIAWAAEHYFPHVDYPYKVTNVFGQLERWKDLREKMAQSEGASSEETSFDRWREEAGGEW